MNRYKNLTANTSLASTLVSIVLIVWIAYILQSVIVPFIIAALFSFLLYPMCNGLERIGLPRVLAIIIVICLTAVVVLSVLYLAYTQIIELQSLFPILEEKSEIWMKDGARFLESNFQLKKDEVLAEIQKHLSSSLKSLSSILGSTLSTTSSFLVSMALMPLYIFLMLLYRDFLNTFVFKWLKNTSKHKIMATISRVKEVINGYIVGLMLVTIIVGVLNTASLMLIGIEHAFFFGFFASFLVILPYIGIAIGASLPIIVALITKDPLAAVAVAGAFAFIQFLEGNFITPYVVGTKVSINSLVAITALLLFGNLWGLGGMILALPVTAIIKVIFDANEKTAAWGFLLGDAENDDVKITQKDFNFKDFFKNVKSKI